MEPTEMQLENEALRAQQIHPGMSFSAALTSADPAAHPALLTINPPNNPPPAGLPLIPVSQEPKSKKQRKKKKNKDEDDQPPPKRHRAKKPVDAPTRPKSAYMFFLSEFREKWKQDNPDSKKVADVAKAAGEVWRHMPAEQKAAYEERSTGAKSAYAVAMKEYDREHPKPVRNRNVKPRDPAELKRPQSAYFFYLADFRQDYKKEHPNEYLQVSMLGKLAGERWKLMSEEEKAPYEELSKASKAEYAKQKMLTPDERRAYAAGLLITPQQMSQLPSLHGPGFPQGAASQHPMLTGPTSQTHASMLSNHPGSFNPLHSTLHQQSLQSGFSLSSGPSSGLTSFGAPASSQQQFQLPVNFPQHLQQFLPQLQHLMQQAQHQGNASGPMSPQHHQQQIMQPHLTMPHAPLPHLQPLSHLQQHQDHQQQVQQQQQAQGMQQAVSAPLLNVGEPQMPGMVGATSMAGGLTQGGAGGVGQVDAAGVGTGQGAVQAGMGEAPAVETMGQGEAGNGVQPTV